MYNYYKINLQLSKNWDFYSTLKCFQNAGFHLGVTVSNNQTVKLTLHNLPFKINYGHEGNPNPNLTLTKLIEQIQKDRENDVMSVW